MKNKKIIFDYIDGRLTASEAEEFHVRLQNDAELNKEYNTVRSLLKEMQENSAPPIDQTYLTNIKYRLHSRQEKKIQQKIFIPRPALLFIIPLFIVSITMYIIQREYNPDEPVILSINEPADTMQDYFHPMNSVIPNNTLEEIVTGTEVSEEVENVFLSELNLDDSESSMDILRDMDIAYDEFFSDLTDEQAEELLAQLNNNEGLSDEK